MHCHYQILSDEEAIMRLQVIACEVMKEELLAATADNGLDFEFVPQGLHVHPEKLNKAQLFLDAHVTSF